MPFTQQDYAALSARLSAIAEEDYRIFTQKLTPGAQHVLGVRLPMLRKIAKELLKGDWRAFLALAKDTTYEEIMLQGMVTALAKCPIEEQIPYAAAYIEKINTWALCDVFCGDWKAAAKYPLAVRAFLTPYLNSGEEFKLRFAVVMLMNYFTTPQAIDDTLACLKQIKHEGYYVKMAVAWAISVAYVRQKEKTLALLKEQCLDPFTQNKAIQKIRESRRVDKAQKERLLVYKMR